jgi:ribosome-interacting GTPase 1
MEEVDFLARQPHSVVISCSMKLGTDYFLEKMWEELGLVRIYTKKVFINIYLKKGQPPDFSEPIVLRKHKGGFSILAAINQIHRELSQNFKEAIVWGKSVKYSPQKCGLTHILADEDVLQILKKSK